MDILVLKCGGSIMDRLSGDFFQSLKELIRNGIQPVIVHGGGPAINSMLALYNMPPKFKDGLRVTCERTMQIVETVLSGQTNRKLVGMLDKTGLKAIGLNGSDGKCLQAEYINRQELGYVGKVTSVRKETILVWLKEGFIPVITPVASGADGARLNVNADYAAAAIARELGADRCVFVTDVEGIIIEGSVVQETTPGEIETHISSGNIYGGMIPKVQSAMDLLSEGIGKVMIVSGKKAFYSKGKWNGTIIAAKEGIKK
ncbi:acetylglutamate kinase [Mesobacillus zeae]|uniref:Acetylglutamate kinase n=1 Tax=Mesobacillus zeae TaxID=1917180 RepID=A0A398B4P7_9BACI|nr:acetylglutamate kinase [Mesobacillus zeae]RID84551.1 acetylglutamate kinase [Mesobacillus zeae]